MFLRFALGSMLRLSMTSVMSPKLVWGTSVLVTAMEGMGKPPRRRSPHNFASVRLCSASRSRVSSIGDLRENLVLFFLSLS